MGSTNPGSLSISAKSTYYTDEDVVVSWNTPENTVKYGFTLRYNPKSGDDLIDHYVTGNSYNIGKLGSGNYRLWMRPYNSSGTGGTAVYVDFSVTTRPVVKVTSVTLNKQSLSLTKGESTTLTASVAPSNATNKNISWSSSNTSVAKVTNGKVQAVGAGTATITATAADGSGKKATCTVKVTNPHTHSYTSKVTKAATCTSEGIRTYTCSCGASYTEKIEKTAHKEVTDSAVKATCTKEGKTEGSHCQVCGTILKAQQTIAATGHTPVTDSAVKATCTKEGKTEGSHCQVCGTVLKAQQTIAATGHKYNTTTIVKATTKENGDIKKTCSVCGHTKKTAIYYPKTVTISSCVYNGKAKKPTVTVKDSKGNVIDSSNYTVTYSNNKNVGKATAAIKFKGNYSGTIKKQFTIKPQGTTITSVKAKSNGFEVKWKKQASQTSGYEIQYSTNKNFKGNTVSTVKIEKNSTQSKKISKLKAKKTYYVRVRTYKTVKIDGKNTKIYSDWSSAKKVVTKN
ncbi:MAG: Ig domain-containing protein [Roseburia sp.]